MLIVVIFLSMFGTPAVACEQACRREQKKKIRGAKRNGSKSAKLKESEAFLRVLESEFVRRPCQQ